MSEWQPIETAPKDGSEIIGGDRGCGDIEFYRWNDEDKKWLSRGDFYEPTNELTHWMPLPEPPK